jgi:hypothetical protein
VKGYYAALNALHLNMDAAALGAFMAPSCNCRQQVRAVQTAASRHERYIDHVRLVSLTPVLDGPNTADVLVEYNAGPAGLVDARGRMVTRTSAKNGIKRLFHLARQSGDWLIVEIDAA